MFIETIGSSKSFTIAAIFYNLKQDKQHILHLQAPEPAFAAQHNANIKNTLF